MRKSISIKMLYRTPFKTAMTFLLILLSTFAIFSRIMDYTVTLREMKHLENQYHAVTALNVGEGEFPYHGGSYGSSMPGSMRTFDLLEPWSDMAFIRPPASPASLTLEQMEAFSKLPNVRTETRYMTAGFIKEFRTIDDSYSPSYTWGFDYTNRYVMEGTFDGDLKSQMPIDDPDTFFPILLSDVKVIAGSFPFLPEDGKEAMIWVTPKPISNATSGQISVTGNNYAVFDTLPYMQKAVDSFIEGERYLFIGNYNPSFLYQGRWESNEPKEQEKIDSFYFAYDNWDEEAGDFTQSDVFSSYYDFLAQKQEEQGRVFSPDMTLADQDVMDYAPPFQSIEGLSDTYLETPEFANTKEIVDIINLDPFTYDMVYVEDIFSIPRFNEGSMVIREGDAFKPEDTNVCVVSWYFLHSNGLQIGDTLTVELGDRLYEQYASLGATTYIPERKSNIVKTVELEIVGAYLDTDTAEERNTNQFWGYGPNTIFVPQTVLPIEIPANHEVKPGEFSIIIDDLDNLADFIAQAEPLAKEMGFGLRVSDGGWKEIAKGLENSKQTALLTLVLYVVGAILGLFLSVYLFVLQNRKNFAIARALGVTRTAAIKTVALPLGILSIVAVLMGGLTGVIFTSMDTFLPFGVLLLCFLVTFGLITFFAILFLSKMANTPILTLLRGEVQAKRKKIAKKSSSSKKTDPADELLRKGTRDYFIPDTMSLSQIKSVEPSRKYSAFRHVTSYIFVNMFREKTKTIILVGLAFLLIGAIGLLTMTKLQYIDLFETVNVQTTATGFSSKAIYDNPQSELLENTYYQGSMEVVLNEGISNTLMYITNQVGRYLQSMDDSSYSIDYLSGYDDSIFLEESANLVIGRDLATSLDLNLGDHISLLELEQFEALQWLYQSEEYLDSAGLADESLEELLHEDGVSFQIVGLLSTDNSNLARGIYAPNSTFIQLVKGARSVYGDQGLPLIFEYSEFILTNNEQVDDSTILLESMVDMSKEDGSLGAEFFTNTAELDNVARVRDLLILLFPIIVAVAIIINILASGLMIMQSSKEVALLRILGVTKRRTRCMLTFGQVLLCFVGSLFSTGVLIIYNASLFEKSLPTFVFCILLYLLGCISGVFVPIALITRRHILELLQVKE